MHCGSVRSVGSVACVKKLIFFLLFRHQSDRVPHTSDTPSVILQPSRVVCEPGVSLCFVVCEQSSIPECVSGIQLEKVTLGVGLIVKLSLYS